MQRTHLIHPIGTETHVFVHFVVFGCVLDHFCTKLGAILAEQVQLVKKVRAHEVMSEFYSMNAPVPPHWNINSGFGVFRCVWLHLGSFRYRTKLDANWVEVVPLLKKDHPMKLCRNFSNERTRSTSLDPKLMFWCVS